MFHRGAADSRLGARHYGMRIQRHRAVLEIIGKDARSEGFSDGYLVGIDGFMLAAFAERPLGLASTTMEYGCRPFSS